MNRLPHLSWLLLPAWNAIACQCGTVPPPREALQKSDAVFAGIVASRSPVLARVDGDLVLAERTEFLVHDSWRGPSEPRIVLLQGFSTCTPSFPVGERYLVFASRHSHQSPALIASTCSPTQHLAHANAALLELGPPMSSRPEVLHASESGRAKLFRHFRASALVGIALASRPLPVPWSPYASRYIYLIIPTSVLFVLCGCSWLVVRRRFHALAACIAPALVLLVAAVLLEGYLHICGSPLLWYLLDRAWPGGV